MVRLFLVPSVGEHFCMALLGGICGALIRTQHSRRSSDCRISTVSGLRCSKRLHTDLCPTPSQPQHGWSPPGWAWVGWLCGEGGWRDGSEGPGSMTSQRWPV